MKEMEWEGLTMDLTVGDEPIRITFPTGSTYRIRTLAGPYIDMLKALAPLSTDPETRRGGSVTEKIEPALTASEWVAWFAGEFFERAGKTWRTIYGGRGWTGEPEPRPNQHTDAALALYGQPFGFTWEDVDALLATSREIERVQRSWHRAEQVRDLADRIEALLPPREHPKIEPL